MRKIIAATFVTVSLAVTQLGGAPSVGAAGAKISFSVAGAAANSSVLFIGTNVALKVPSTAKSATLSKKFYSASSKKYQFSVHLLGADGKYAGPVVFKTSAKKTTYSVNVATKGAASLGKFTVKSGGWLKASKVLGTGWYGKTLRGPAKDGKPKGAGMVGALKKSSVTAKGVRALASGVSCTKVDQTLGADCDGDGVPNAVDADDNNNGTLDVADKATSGFEAQKSLPWSTLYLEIGGMQKNLNANLAGITTADIDEVMAGSTGTFTVAFYINLPPGEANGYDAVWVDCGALAYCAKDTGTARTGSPSGSIGEAWSRMWCKLELNSAGYCPEAYPWTEYTGSTFTASGVGTKVDAGKDGVWNGLTRFVNNGDAVWSGGMIPNVTNDILQKVKVADPYVLRMRAKGTGVVTQRPMALGAFFVTVPVVTSATVGGTTTDVDYSQSKPYGSNQDPIVLDDDGTFTITFYRPQRSAIDGADPAGTTFMDLGGLRYGLIMSAESGDRSALTGTGNAREVGCTSKEDAGTYAAIPSDFKRTPDNKERPEDNGNVWPLTDTFLDAVPNASRTLTITFNMKKCINELRNAPAQRRAVVDFSRTHQVPIQLTAAGIDLEGGASRAAQTFYVQLPDSATGW